jgi:hypothetical protein
MPLQVGREMILRGCAWMSRKRIFSSSRYSARWVWSRPVCLPSASQAFTATWPLVSGASMQDHLAGVDVGLDLRACRRCRPRPSPAVELAELLDLGLVFQAMPLPPLPTLFHQRPSAVKRL